MNVSGFAMMTLSSPRTVLICSASNFSRHEPIRAIDSPARRRH
jgi:hypothetical protein